jgi:hypothetical protein
MNQPIPSYRRYLLLALTLLFSVEGAILLLTRSQAAGPQVAASQAQNAPAAAGEVDLSFVTKLDATGNILDHSAYLGADNSPQADLINGANHTGVI